MKQYLEKSYGLNLAQLAGIQHLETACNQYEGLAMKLNWNMLRDRQKDQNNDFLYYSHGRLVGYLALYGFNQREAEVSAMIHPEYRRRGIFKQLLAAAKLELKKRQVPDFLFICERACTSATACMQAISAGYDFSEYKMRWQQVAIKSGSAPIGLQLRPGRLEDIADLVHMDELCFGVSAEAAKRWLMHDLADSNRRILLATLDSIKIGKLNVLLSEAETYISGFCVLPEYRRKGYGKIMLTHTLEQLVAENRHNISLEVATENEQALSLYEHCGFQTITAYDYYRLSVDGTY